jgi:ClpP class serine protease
MHWLLDESAARAMREARALGVKPTDAQITAFQEQVAGDRDDRPRILQLAGSVAEIRIEGVLTKTADIWSMLFGGGNTTYRQIIASLAIAKSDPNVKQVVLYVDSPGGTVDGLFDTLAEIEGFKGVKPLTVKANRALSAAYGIAAAAGRIEATNVAASFGSVGVAASFYVSDYVVDITNTESPDKRPDVKTPEGKKVVQRELDAIADLFVDAIARGRGTTVKDVFESFGRGATLLAGDAKKRGMIDSVAKPALRAVVGVAAGASVPVEDSGGNAQERKSTNMDLRTLKAQHPDIYEQCVAEGVKSERDRVCAHIVLGEPIGADGIAIALAAIKSGAPMSHTQHATYIAAAMNTSDRRTRQQESDAAGAAANGATPPPEPKPQNAKASANQPPADDESMGAKVVKILKAGGGIGA